MSRLLFSSILLMFLSISVAAYESENKLKTVIVGKVAKYILWQNNERETFVITVLNSSNRALFDEVYFDKKIKSKPVLIRYVDTIDDIGTTDILFISELRETTLDEVLVMSKNRNILTVSDMRGFAHKGGNLQLYFVGQKLKLKMNINAMQEEGFHVKRALLKIVEVVETEEEL